MPVTHKLTKTVITFRICRLCGIAKTGPEK